MTTSPSLARPEIQAELISDALSSASVGFLVWDETRRYIAANAAACDILGTTLELLGQQVGGHTVEGLDPLDAALAAGFTSGQAVVQRFDGRGPIDVFYATFTTKTAGMPFMATVISPMSEAEPGRDRG